MRQRLLLSVFLTGVIVLCAAAMVAVAQPIVIDRPTKGAAHVSGEPIVALLQGAPGRVVIVPEGNLVQFVVSVNGLAGKAHEIELQTVPSGGVVFGQGNAHLQLGHLQGDTSIVPDGGRVLMWSVHPARIGRWAKEAWVVIREKEGREVARSEPFSLEKP